VTVRPPVSNNNLRLEVVPMAVDEGDQGFELCLMDAADTAIMTLILSESIVRALVATQEDWRITMSPSGSIEVYNYDAPSRLCLKIGLNDLIRQNLTPDMLEDEPDLSAQLTTLRHKLTASLAFVEQTLANLDKPVG
jgi:hypothetical protein